jgi:hypothetical protein
MENLKINATDITPEINFNILEKTFVISGESRPENVKDFFEPILNWLDTYFSQFVEKEKHIFTIKLAYFNSSSAKFLLSLLKNLGKYYQNGIKIEVNWCYEEGDDDMKEAGEQMSEMAKIPFAFIEVDEF